MILEFCCHLLWCDIGDKKVCQIEKVPIRIYNETKRNEIRTITLAGEEEMLVIKQKVEQFLGCWESREK